MNDLVLNWTKELGWEDNPFTFDLPTPIEKFIGGYEQEREALNLFLLKEKKFGTIKGPPGMGKTILLQWFIENLQKHKFQFTPVLITKEDLKDEKTLITALSSPYLKKNQLKEAIGSILGKKQQLNKKNIHTYLAQNITNKYILLIDDADLLAKEDIELLERLKDLPKTAIILAGKLDKINTKSLGKDELSLDMKKLDFAGSKAMLQKRIEKVEGTDIWPFTDKILKDLFPLADYNPKKILELAQERAKELAIDVKMGKIKRPEKKLIHIEHDYTFRDTELAHPPVDKKHHDTGLTIKFTFKNDDDKEHPAAHEEKLPKREPQETIEKPDQKGKQTEEIEEETELKKKTAEETEKKTEKDKKTKKTEEPAEQESIIDINLGYEEKTQKKETPKPKKIEPFTIDIAPKKKKK